MYVIEQTINYRGWNTDLPKGSCMNLLNGTNPVEAYVDLIKVGRIEAAFFRSITTDPEYIGVSWEDDNADILRAIKLTKQYFYIQFGGITANSLGVSGPLKKTIDHILFSRLSKDRYHCTLDGFATLGGLTLIDIDSVSTNYPVIELIVSNNIENPEMNRAIMYAAKGWT